MAISYVASSSWSTSTSGTGFTITKPSGTVSGDIMVAMVIVDLYIDGTQKTVTVPSGWTKLEDIYSDPDLQAAIMYRVAGSSEPGSWAGSLSGSREQRVTICGTYRGATSAFADESANTIGGATSLNSGTVTNPTATNWRITFGAYMSGSRNYIIQSNEISSRKIDGAIRNIAIEGGLWDSNGTIATGSSSRNITRGASWQMALAYVTILDASDVSIPGTLSATLSLPTVSASVSASHDGPLAVDLPLLVVDYDGIASPPEGPLEVLVLPEVSVGGGVESVGTLDVLVMPSMGATGETRFFGIRVVIVEQESRVTTPRLGAVD